VGLLSKPNDGFGLFGSFGMLKNADINGTGYGRDVHMMEEAMAVKTQSRQSFALAQPKFSSARDGQRELISGSDI
jgi:hypothetical protein